MLRDPKILDFSTISFSNITVLNPVNKNETFPELLTHYLHIYRYLQIAYANVCVCV